MAESASRLGFWIRIVDRQSALYAVRMSGLPIFLFGVSLIISGIVLAVDPLTPARWEMVLAAAGVPAILMGLAVRGGRIWPAPWAATAFLAICIAEAVLAPSAGLIVRWLIALVAISGLRGWLWLRRHPA